MAKAKKRPPPRGFSSWKTYMASIRPNPKKRRSVVRTSTSQPSQPMATKTRRSSAARQKIATSARSVASRARSAVSRSGIVPFATTAAMDAAGVLTGKVLVRAIRARTPIAAGTAMAALVEIALGVLIGTVVGKKNKVWGQRIAIGAMLGPMETMLKRFNLPVIGEALGEDGYILTDLGDDGIELVESYDDTGPEFTALSNFVSGAPLNDKTYEFGGYVNDSMSDSMRQ